MKKKIKALAVASCLIFASLTFGGVKGECLVFTSQKQIYWDNQSTGHTGFSRGWSATYSYSFTDGNGMRYTLEADYGYETFLTNEDYINNVHCLAPGTGITYHGEVYNSTSQLSKSTSPKTNCKKTGKADIRHSSGKIVYYIKYQ